MLLLIEKEAFYRYIFFASIFSLFCLNLFLVSDKLDIGEKYWIEGEVIRSYDKIDEYQRVIVKTNSINRKDKVLKLSLQLRNSIELNQYDNISGLIKVKEINGNENFGLVNNRDYYLHENIANQARVEEIKSFPTGNIFKIKKINIKTLISSLIDENLEEKNAGIIKKLLLNDTRDLEENVEEAYRISGLSHILAVSGLHIGILIYFFEACLKKLKFSFNIRFILITAFLIFYGFILDYTPSVTRAILMYFLFRASEIGKIHLDRIDLMLISMILLLLINPLWIYKLGFQLSFLSVYGIIVIYEKIFMKKTNNMLLKPIYLYISVNIMIFPLLIYRFNSFNLLSIFSNILLTPVLSLVLIMSFFAIFLNKLAFVSTLIFRFVDLLLNFSSFYIDILIRKFSLNISFLFPGLIFIVFYYSLLAFLLDQEKKYLLYINRYMIYSLLLLSLFYRVIIPKPLILGFYDVGNGDSSYIYYKDKYFQFDTGGSNFGDYNPGKEVTSKAISNRGINFVELLILSHFDSDHILGTEDLINKGLVKNIIINRKAENEEVYQLIKNSQVNHLLVKNGSKLKIDDKLSFEFFNSANYETNDENKASLITLINYDGRKILIGGDATSDIEELYMKDFGDIDILKVGHHGSRTSSSLNFLEYIRPEYSVISVGKNNTYGHPAPEVLENLKKVNSKILRTDKLGEIVFKIDDKISYTYYNEEWKERIDRNIILFSVIIILFCVIGCEEEDEIQGFQKYIS